MKQPLRFAPIVRVSTETQEKAGESLKTQRTQIENYVRNLGGKIPDYCWAYSGQEHATPDQERRKLHQLLADSSKGIFDAVIVCDASRWTRDNLESKKGLKILRDNHIKFFVAGQEFDLASPEQRLFLGLSAEFHEFQAKQQKLKSIQNRIARAKRGIPTAGRLPYGRTFNSTTGKWGLDKKKVKDIEWAAEQYLSGKSAVAIAQTLGMDSSYLWEVLTKRSGDEWSIEFTLSEMNIHEIVKIKVPPLLSNQTISAIHERAQANKTYMHGQIKNKYLLSRMVFCTECGGSFSGQTNHGNRRYYCHPDKRKTQCDPSIWVRADMLEEAVLHHIFHIFGDVASMKKSIAKAIPNPSQIVKLEKQKSFLENKITATIKEKQNLVRSIAKGILTDEEAANDMNKIRERENALSLELNIIQQQLEHIPTKQFIDRKVRYISNFFTQLYKSHNALSGMSYENKRELVAQAFAGRDSEGRRRGVYVRKTNNTDKPWEFTIRGVFGEYIGQLPLSELDLELMTEAATSLAMHWPAPSP